MAVFKNGIFYPEAGNFIITAGLTDETQMKAINKLVWDLKVYNVWDKMKAIYPMVGQAGVSSSFQFNLKDPTTFKGTFNGTWTFASTGATPNGTNAYFDTTLTPSVSLSSINNLHLSFYSRTQNTTTGRWNIGVDSTTPNTGFLDLGIFYATVSRKIFINGAYPTYAVTSNETNTKGLILGVAESSVLRKLHFNGTLLATTTNTSPTTLPSNSIYIGSGRNSSTGNAADFSPHECAFSSIGDELTDIQASNFYTAVQRFQTTLGRQV